MRARQRRQQWWCLSGPRVRLLASLKAPRFSDLNNAAAPKRVKDSTIFSSGVVSRRLMVGYSEELFPFTEEEYEEVMAASLDDNWQGHEELSVELEQARFEAELEHRATVNTPNGAILIKRECSHPECSISRCKKSQRIGGIEI